MDQFHHQYPEVSKGNGKEDKYITVYGVEDLEFKTTWSYVRYTIYGQSIYMKML